MCSLRAAVVLISLWAFVLSFSHEAVKSMFHTQMRWVSLLTHPCLSDPSPSLAWLPDPPFPTPCLLSCDMPRTSASWLHRMAIFPALESTTSSSPACHLPLFYFVCCLLPFHSSHFSPMYTGSLYSACHEVRMLITNLTKNRVLICRPSFSPKLIVPRAIFGNIFW